MRNSFWLYLSVFMGVLLGGAILTKIYHYSTPIVVENDNYAPVEQATPQKDTLEYHLLVADLAWQRELWPQAADHYLTLAKETNRADFALLAASAALEGQLLPEARESAELWAVLEPENSKAKALAATLCIVEFNEELAFSYLNQLMAQMPDEALPHLLLINTTLQDPKEQALFFSLLQRLTYIYEDQPSLWFVFARQAQSMKQYALALIATDQTLALEPDWISAIALRVQILYQMGDKATAKDYLATVVKKFPEHADLNFIYTEIAKETESPPL